MLYEISHGEGPHRVTLQATVSTNGVILSLQGGDLPHIGGVAVGVPRPSSRDPSRITANVSVISILGHKDDELARPLADKVVRKLGQIVVVIAGIHVDDATPQDLEAVIRNAHAAVDEWLEKV
ncbi:MAG: hypothetical protein HYY20_01580 [Candidatus Tectomicrobia bacterium]|uniref:Prenylated flavin chaperone LpdD-like domain-containing protein n=1 Tax=Tectimicrobiota bacterium TaxID=2528274 RepID=A0A932CLE4_UNCTE|nr:hypothetical protein [Candidatus Tectomicrobia bacterium]